jgi:hypothetical protein
MKAILLTKLKIATAAVLIVSLKNGNVTDRGHFSLLQFQSEKDP